MKKILRNVMIAATMISSGSELSAQGIQDSLLITTQQKTEKSPVSISISRVSATLGLLFENNTSYASIGFGGPSIELKKDKFSFVVAGYLSLMFYEKPKLGAVLAIGPTYTQGQTTVGLAYTSSNGSNGVLTSGVAIIVRTSF